MMPVDPDGNEYERLMGRSRVMTEDQKWEYVFNPKRTERISDTMARQARPKPFEFEARGAEPLTIKDAVMQALGAASTCWENLSGTGVFDDVRAREIGGALILFIEDRMFDTARASDEPTDAEDTESPRVKMTAGSLGLVQSDEYRSAPSDDPVEVKADPEERMIGPIGHVEAPNHLRFTHGYDPTGQNFETMLTKHEKMHEVERLDHSHPSFPTLLESIKCSPRKLCREPDEAHLRMFGECYVQGYERHILIGRVDD